MTTTTSILQLDDVSRTFKKGSTPIPVLQHIDLTINKLEFLCLVGESGCGKTTTGKILSGLLQPTGGRVLFEGQDVSTLKGEAYRRYRRSVQIIHQDPYASLNPTHTIFNVLSYPLFRHKLVRNKDEARVRVQQLLDRVDLTADLVDKYPHQLSGGQRQRVSIARALTTNPSVIVADEAVSMVDVSIRMGILNMLMDMRIAVMYLGRVVEIGRTQEIIAAPQHPYTKVLLSAIPEADPARTRSKTHIQLRSEDIPRLTELPPGCSFHPRCPWFVPGTCDVRVPPLERVPDAPSNAEVACIPLTEGRGLTLYDSTPAEA
jgi:peptide/nickel transport system ATP-binding protein